MTTTRQRIYGMAAIAAVFALGAAVWRYPTYRVEQMVRSQLRDPDSARFEGVAFFRKTGGACGYVNAKNGLGGYVGFRHFYLDNRGKAQFEPDPASEIASPQQKLDASNAKIAYVQSALVFCPEAEEAK